MGETTEQLQDTVEGILEQIIDEWYEKVSAFYVTADQLQDEDAASEEELKRFHDSNGHRIKFSKDELDFTYGLRSYVNGDDVIIEVSVNNKVENFDVDAFREKLSTHYQSAGQRAVPTPYELRNRTYSEIFLVDSNFGEALEFERRKGKADIIRLSFRLNPETVDKMLDRPVSSKELVENFCVTPFRNIYASVYRRGA